jgi:chromosome partitioning protein
MTRHHTRYLAVLSEKGGVCKTTLAALLAMAAARDGLTVTAVDLDPRATLTKLLGAEPKDRGLSVDAIIGADRGDDLTGWGEQLRVASTWHDSLYVLPAERSLGNREKGADDLAERRLAAALDGMPGELVIIDTPPRPGGVLILSALALPRAGVLYAATLDQDGLDGIAEAWRTVATAERYMHSDLWTVGIALSRANLQLVDGRRCRDELVDAYGAEMVLSPAIAERVIVREARAAGDWVGNYAGGHEVAEQAHQLWETVRHRLDNHPAGRRKEHAS